MSNTLTKINRRILIVDDNAAMHENFRKILGLGEGGSPELDAVEHDLFESEQSPSSATTFEIDSAYQGREALAMVRRSRAEGRPYAMAFLDVRMPPGWDGIETAERIWAEYPDLQIVLCTAYSDYSWIQMIKRLGCSDRLLILKKPFDNIEALQMACTLTMKWQLIQLARLQWRELETRIDERTQDLEQAYLQLREKSPPYSATAAGRKARAAKPEALRRDCPKPLEPVHHKPASEINTHVLDF